MVQVSRCWLAPGPLQSRNHSAERKIVDMEIEVICQQNRLTTFNIQTHMLGPKKE
jgi:hypothetical protein